MPSPRRARASERERRDCGGELFAMVSGCAKAPCGTCGGKVP